ncbi:hypothetical protein AAEX28_04515 [Lentisphaerota bacterium WC36G]|nr:hypothetical protein LJT99_07375 [Lentisphaerae bacterium WC36]
MTKFKFSLIILALLITAIFTSSNSFAAKTKATSSKKEEIKTSELNKISADKLFDNEQQIQNYCNSFLTELKKDDIPKALELFDKKTILLKKEADFIKKKISTHIPLMASRYGKIIDIEFVKKETLAPSIIKMVYLLKFEKHFIAWKFYFYKPQDKWLFSQVMYSDQPRFLE